MKQGQTQPRACAHRMMKTNTMELTRLAQAGPIMNATPARSIIHSDRTIRILHQHTLCRSQCRNMIAMSEHCTPAGCTTAAQARQACDFYEKRVSDELL